MNTTNAHSDLETRKLIESLGAGEYFDKSGVYAIYDGETPLYFGESQNIYKRLAAHAYHIVEIKHDRTWLPLPAPLYYHMLDAHNAGNLRFVILATDIENKKDRIAIEDKACVEHGQNGIYNFCRRKTNVWKSLLTHPTHTAEQKRKEDERAHKLEQKRLKQIERDKELLKLYNEINLDDISEQDAAIVKMMINKIGATK